MKVVKTYDSFNFRRYSNPWVAIVNKSTGKIDFSQRVGDYTGGYNKAKPVFESWGYEVKILRYVFS